VRQDWSSSGGGYGSRCLNSSALSSGKCEIVDKVQIEDSGVAFQFYTVGLYGAQLQGIL